MAAIAFNLLFMPLVYAAGHYFVKIGAKCVAKDGYWVERRGSCFLRWSGLIFGVVSPAFFLAALQNAICLLAP